MVGLEFLSRGCLTLIHKNGVYKDMIEQKIWHVICWINPVHCQVRLRRLWIALNADSRGLQRYKTNVYVFTIECKSLRILCIHHWGELKKNNKWQSSTQTEIGLSNGRGTDVKRKQSVLEYTPLDPYILQLCLIQYNENRHTIQSMMWLSYCVPSWYSELNMILHDLISCSNIWVTLWQYLWEVLGRVRSPGDGGGKRNVTEGLMRCNFHDNSKPQLMVVTGARKYYTANLFIFKRRYNLELIAESQRRRD